MNIWKSSKSQWNYFCHPYAIKEWIILLEQTIFSRKPERSEKGQQQELSFLFHYWSLWSPKEYTPDTITSPLPPCKAPGWHIESIASWNLLHTQTVNKKKSSTYELSDKHSARSPRSDCSRLSIPPPSRFLLLVTKGPILTSNVGACSFHVLLSRIHMFLVRPFASVNQQKCRAELLFQR